MRAPTLLLGLAIALPAHATEAPERVVMTLPEFLKLYEAAKDKDKEPEKAPLDYSAPSAHYDGEVVLEDGEPVSAVFRATLNVEILKAEGWTKVWLLPTGVALRSATIDGQEAPVVVDGAWYVLVTDRRGAFEVELEFAASVFTSEGSSGLSFELTRAASSEIRLAVPAREDLAFTVANARIQQDRVEGDRRIVEASLPPSGTLSITWQREIPEAEELDPRIYAEVYTLVGIGDGLLQATSTLHHTILFAPVDHLEVQIPDGMTLLDVAGAGIRDWTLSEGGQLSVLLNYAAEGAYPLTLTMEKVVGQGDLVAVAPLPVPLGAERVKGWLGVEARGNLEIAGQEAKGATPVDVRSLPAAILGITGQPVLLGYKYLEADATIPLQVSQHDDVDVLVTLLDQTRATTMWTRDGRRLTSVKYQVRNNRKQFLRMKLPEGSELWSASLGGRAVQPALSGDGRVLVPLVRSQTAGGALAAFEVEVVYVEDAEGPNQAGRGAFRAELPTADVPSTYVSWVVYSPEDAKVRKASVDGSLRKVDYLSNPIPSQDVYYIEAATPQVMQSASSQARSGAFGEGAVPVPVSLPIEGTPVSFEKLLALGETLWVSFDYRGLKD
ncbi:MAG: hypothetical protein JRI25_10540 [Deltaproteobacteria bacterium]|nr:hypothetical protein [Deltaproteobacteria bacterium]MBW2255021.1 hypothetical protein [Deltaproteobacteria bacterium]